MYVWQRDSVQYAVGTSTPLTEQRHLDTNHIAVLNTAVWNSHGWKINKGKVPDSAFVHTQANSLTNAAENEVEAHKTYCMHNLQIANRYLTQGQNIETHCPDLWCSHQSCRRIIQHRKTTLGSQDRAIRLPSCGVHDFTAGTHDYLSGERNHLLVIVWCCRRMSSCSSFWKASWCRAVSDLLSNLLMTQLLWSSQPNCCGLHISTAKQDAAPQTPAMTVWQNPAQLSMDLL